MIKTTFILAMFFHAYPADAQDSTLSYNLEQFVSLSQKHNAEIQAANWNLKAIKTQQTKAKRSSILPRLRINSESGIVPDAKGDIFNPPSDTLGIRPLGPFNRTQLEAIQPLFPFSRARHMLEAIKNKVTIGEADRMLTIGEVTYKIKEYYHGILLAQDLFDLAQRLKSELYSRKDQLEGTTSLPISGPYKLELAILEVESLAREAHDKIILGRHALALQAGFSKGEETTPAAQWLAPVQSQVPALEKLISIALERRPELLKLQAGINATSAIHKAALDAYKPEIFLGGGIRFAIAPGRTDQRNPFVRDEFNLFGGAVFLGVKQSLEFHLISTDVERAKAEHGKLSSTKSSLVQLVRLEVEQKYKTFLRAQENLSNLRQSRSISRQWLNEAQAEYEFDEGALKELINAFENWAKIEQSYFEHIYDFNISLAQLELATGNTILSSENLESINE